ncbi:hypothetical protein BS47DRAFT_1367842 [Hydnum rufescens UP504]|uniref:Uncharacterized protein n=1 Tax=Hydnum rufescens UP504 TaxID=1448309 RepID=A0A9P6AH68_9AGAM|nr:hypothetical protein BS47DRAFT_1367842 [Hydnum rufescens UP504]
MAFQTMLTSPRRSEPDGSPEAWMSISQSAGNANIAGFPQLECSDLAGSTKKAFDVSVDLDVKYFLLIKLHYLDDIGLQWKADTVALPGADGDPEWDVMPQLPLLQKARSRTKTEDLVELVIIDDIKSLYFGLKLASEKLTKFLTKWGPRGQRAPNFDGAPMGQ